MNNPKLVVIGGGTGSFTLLSELKNYTKNLTALVAMADDGGSTGVLRDEYGVLPPGDVRQCLVALSRAPQLVRDLFNFRFPADTTFAGHSFGNLFLSAVELMTDNFSEAVTTASSVLNITGRVFPMSLDKTELVMEVGGDKIIGEHAVSSTDIAVKINPKLYLSPEAKINPDAKNAIDDADLIIIAPGDLYSSITPALLVDGVSDSLKNAKAKIVYVCNLVNKKNHTRSFSVSDYVNHIEKLIGTRIIDIVLYNIDLPSKDLLEKYASEGEYPVIVDDNLMINSNFKAIGGNYLSHQEISRNKDDTLLKRSLIRHDAHQVSESIMRCL